MQVGLDLKRGSSMPPRPAMCEKSAAVREVEWRFGGKNRWMEDIPRIFPFGEAEYLGSRCWFEMFF